MRKIIFMCFCFASAVLVFSCSVKWRSDDYLNWMYKYMPVQDSLGFERSWWMSNVEKTLEIRKKMSWNIPEREFRHFVLPLRVNNEYLDDFRTIYADTLCNRVKGMTMEQAALEINHWCYEQATYHGSDARTMSPMDVVRSGLGRCGEESVLAVAALRAAGLPARQVYTPRWAHTDDNHAWVEVWTDGEWHFMGACEPEPVLDLGWFNSPVSRALILTTNVFGDYDGPESVIAKNECYTKINLINSYVPSRRAEVTIVDTLGNPVSEAMIDFTIYNYAEFCTVANMSSDIHGKACIDMGLGSMLVRASKENMFGLAVLDSEAATIVLNHKVGEVFSVDFDIVPPPENPLPSKATQEQIEENKLRLERGAEIRNSHDHTNPALTLFREKYGKKSDILLGYLSKKDLDDVSYDVLEDALLSLPDTRKDVLGPRVELEHLLPFRRDVLMLGLDKHLKSFDDVDKWVNANIKILTHKNCLRLVIPPAVVLKSRCADERSIKVFKVALCRSVGLPAAIDDVTGNTSMELASMDKGGFNLSYNRRNKVPEYYRDFTVSRFDNGGFHLLNFGDDTEEISLDKMKIPDLEKGYYCVTSGRRLPDGSVLARQDFFNIIPESIVNRELVVRTVKEEAKVIGNFDPKRLEITDISGNHHKFSELSDKEYYLIALLGQNDEPSMHALRNLKNFMRNSGNSSITLLVFGNTSLDGISDKVITCKDNTNIQEYLASSVTGITGTKPLIMLCDPKGKVYYISQGYNPVLNANLQERIKPLVRK